MNISQEGLSASLPSSGPDTPRATGEALSVDVGPQQPAISGAWLAVLCALAVERDRLAAVLHMNSAHPDYEYLINFGGSPTPPGAHMGEDWEPNWESTSWGIPGGPGFRSWSWRRRKDHA